MAETFQPVTVAELRRRFGLPGNRAALSLMRQMRHVKRGRDCYTSEAWLMEWAAGREMPAERAARQRLRRDRVSYDPLEQIVEERCTRILMRLASHGVIRVVAANGFDGVGNPLTPALSPDVGEGVMHNNNNEQLRGTDERERKEAG